MIQVYFLSVIYLLLSSLLMLLDFYRTELSFLLTLSHKIKSEAKTRSAFALTGALLSLLELLFPIYPGPRVLGDLIPSIATLLLVFWYGRLGGDEVKQESFLTDGKVAGYLLLAIALIHFLFPMAVLF